MQAVLESVADGLYVADSQGKMTFINPAGAQLLGYDSASELIGRSPHATFHHSHTDGTAFRVEDCPLAKVRITGEAIHADDDGFWRKDGSAIPVSYPSAPVHLHDGTGSVVAFRDITERQTRELQERHELEALSWLDGFATPLTRTGWSSMPSRLFRWRCHRSNRLPRVTRPVGRAKRRGHRPGEGSCRSPNNMASSETSIDGCLRRRSVSLPREIRVDQCVG